MTQVNEMIIIYAIYSTNLKSIKKIMNNNIGKKKSSFVSNLNVLIKIKAYFE